MINGWDTATYRTADHPLQVGIRETFEELTGEPVVAVAVETGVGRRCCRAL